MAVRSLAQQSLISPTSNNSMLAGYQTNVFHHLETIRLASSASSVEFTNLGQYSDFQHLQLRVVARTDRANSFGLLNLAFNGDTTNSYASHELYGQPSVVLGDNYSSRANIRVAFRCAGGTSPASSYGGGILDILDFNSSLKNTTIRSISGGSDSIVCINSGLYASSDPITSMQIGPESATAIEAGSRFSLYGLKVRA